MEEEVRLNDIAENLLILNKHTIDTLFSLDNCADCVALYIFFYKTAKWQKTNSIKANEDYIKKSLGWGYDKIRKAKNTLKENGLIQIIQNRKDDKIEGWYIQVSYLVSQNSTDKIKVINNTQKQEVGNPTSRNQEANALKYNNICLNNIDNMLENNNKNNTYKEKENIKEKSTKFQKPTLEELQAYIDEKGYHFSAEAFIDYYDSVGWKIGKSPMKSWKSACNTWERKYKENNSYKNPYSSGDISRETAYPDLKKNYL